MPPQLRLAFNIVLWMLAIYGAAMGAVNFKLHQLVRDILKDLAERT